MKSNYKEEMLSMVAILNLRTIILNIQHKLISDHNVKKIFDLIPRYTNDYSDLSWNDRYFFEKEVPELLLTLNTLMQVLLNNEEYAKIPSEDFIIKCKHFPDSNGRTFMHLFSYIPLLILIDEDLKYKEAMRYNSDEYVESAKKYQDEQIFNDRGLFKINKFPDDENLIDYSLQHRVRQIRVKEYESYRKNEIKNELNILVKKITSSENFINDRVELGCIFWDSKINAIKKRKENFTKSISSVLNALSNSLTNND